MIARLKQTRALAWAIPLLNRVDHILVKVVRYRANRVALNALAITDLVDAERICRSLKQLNLPLSDSDICQISAIERERSVLLERQGFLVDGSLGSGGLYDDGETIAGVCRVSKPSKPALLLYLLIRAFKPQAVIELGTNVGISSAFIATGLETNHEHGELITLEASPYRLKLARQVHSNLGLNNVTYVQGLFTETLERTLHDSAPIDFAFIDGHHQYQPTLDYFEQIVRVAAPGTVFVFDDIRWSEGMKEVWDVLRNDERFGLVVDLLSVGVCVLRHPNEHARYVIPPLAAW